MKLDHVCENTRALYRLLQAGTFYTELPVADVNDCRVLKEQIHQNNKDI